MVRLSEKYNDSCLKIFALLLLFARGTADFSEVIQIFADENMKTSQNSNVLLNKYMNTIRIFGVEVEKSKGKYTLKHMPFSINLTEEELQAVALIKSAVNFLPDGKNKTNILELINNLQNKYDKETRILDNVIISNKNYDLSFYFKKFEKQIAECETYLHPTSRVELTYTTDDGDAVITCIPKEITYLDKVVCYSVFNVACRQIFDIPFDRIKSIRKIPGRVTVDTKCTTVVYKLKPPLAERYKLRDWETQAGKDENGWVTISNSGEDFDVLCSRLLRYDDKCVVVSPDYFQSKMIDTIDEMLNYYQ